MRGFLYWGLQASDAAWYRGGTKLIDGERKSLRYVVMLMADFRFHAEAGARCVIFEAKTVRVGSEGPRIRSAIAQLLADAVVSAKHGLFPSQQGVER